jgi:hypothetical protein
MKAFGLVLSLILGTQTLWAEEAEAPPPSEIKIKQLTYGGNGCPQGTVALDLSDDGEAFTLIFDEFIAEKDGRGGDKKNCKVQFSLTNPEGWRYALFSAHVRGFADLDRNVVGEQVLRVRSSADMVNVKMSFKGPVSEDYQQSKEMPIRNLKWSSCRKESKALTLNSSVRVRGGGPQNGGIMTVDTIDGEVSQKYGIAWQRCSDTKQKVMAMCKIVSSDDFEFTATAFGKNAAKAKAKAMKKVTRKCNGKNGRGFCPVPSCEVANT